MDSVSNSTQLTMLSFVLVLIVGAVGVLYILQQRNTSTPTDEKLQNKTEVFLSDRSKKQVRLHEKIVLSHDTRLFRFALPKPDLVLGLPVGKHFKVYAPNVTGVVDGHWNGRPDPEAGTLEIERKYTPTSSNENLGYFDLVIKVYKGGEDAKFPDGGKMSQFLDILKIGDKIEMSGPYGLHKYLGKGEFHILKKKTKYAKIGMIAGGTGITPMLQIITAVLKNLDDTTELFLLYANKSESDILVRDMLEALEQANPTRFHLHYTLDKAPENGWKYSEGFVNADMIKATMPPPDPQTLILICGPPPMINFACKPNLDKLGYAKEHVREC